MDEKTIKETLLKGERVTLECKKAKAEVPKSVWATYSAFANTIGGLILLGVDENLQEKDISKRFQIIGVDEPSKIITDFWYTKKSCYFFQSYEKTREEQNKHVCFSSECQ